jgi:Heavy metal associated domain 2
MVPFAQIAHCTTHRLRLKIARRRGDQTYFSNLTSRLTQAFAACTVQANSMTGSIVINGDAVDAQAISDFGSRQALFQVQPSGSESHPMALSFIAPLQTVNRKVKAATSNRLDLPGAFFIALILFGIIEIVRGNWKSPPWYTVFWYAFGLYSKTLFDQAVAMGKADAGVESK